MLDACCVFSRETHEQPFEGNEHRAATYKGK